MSGLEELRQKEDVTFAQLRMFVHVAEAGSFARAADELNITQAAVSYQIRTLEDRLHRQLFRRQRGARATLTADGSEALETAIKVLEVAEGLSVTSDESTPTIRVKIATGPFLIEECLRPIMPRIHRQFSSIEIEAIQNSSPEDAMRAIIQGNLDIAIFSIPADVAAPRHPHLSWELPMILVARPGTRRKLAAGEASLNNFQFIFPTSKEGGARWAKRCLRDLGISSQSSPLFSEFVDVIAQMVRDGAGIGYVARHHVIKNVNAGDLEILDVPLPSMRRIMVRSPHSPDFTRAIEEMICGVLNISD